MRHRKAGRKLGRSASHRRAMFANMVSALIRHGRITTTEAKAKELRRVAERAVNWGVSLGELLNADRDKLDADERARVVHHMRMARRVVRDRDALQKLFNEVAPRFVGRLPGGGYTRVIKLARKRRGDGACMAIVEFIDYGEEQAG